VARPLRIQYPGAFYHITARGNEQKKIFLTKSDYAKFKGYLKEAQTKYGFLLHGYVLMGNHYHLLLETPTANLSKLMHYLNSSYTTYFNLKRKRSGHLFQGRFKAILVEAENYLLELSRYLHLNPVRAGIVKLPEQYPYSSYPAYVFSDRQDIVTRNLIWGMMGKDTRRAPKLYRGFIESGLRQDIPDPLGEVYGGIILGKKNFIKDALSQVEAKNLNDREISYRRLISHPTDLDDILSVISSHNGLQTKNLTSSHDIRNIVIYFAKKYTSLTNMEIGQRFGNLSYSAVSKICSSLAVRLGSDPGLRKQIHGIEARLSRVKV
jgi:putative transposase